MLSKKLTGHFGFFDEKWISKIKYRLDNDIHYFQFQVRFVPFLVDVDLEAHFDGSTRKVALLQIDEKVFDPVSDRVYAQTGVKSRTSTHTDFSEKPMYIFCPNSPHLLEILDSQVCLFNPLQKRRENQIL